MKIKSLEFVSGSNVRIGREVLRYVTPAHARSMTIDTALHSIRIETHDGRVLLVPMSSCVVEIEESAPEPDPEPVKAPELDPVEVLPCTLCDRTFRSAQGLAGHMRHRHSGS